MGNAKSPVTMLWAIKQQEPQRVKRAARALMRAHRYVFDNKKRLYPF
jgi:hypothetical protein